MNENLIFDTTFVLPLFGIQVDMDEQFQDEIKKIWSEGIENYNLYISSISLLEVSYKLNKEYRLKNQTGILNRYELILPSITHSKVFSIHSTLLDAESSRFFYKIRETGHTDLLDCWILSSALSLKGIFVTEDLSLKKMVEKFKLKIWNWEKLRKILE